MSTPFATAQAAEDAFYDALEERDADLMARVWDDSPDVACMLPMQPIVHGVQVRNMMRDLLRSKVPLDIKVTHIRWVELGDVAIHYLEEHNNAARTPANAPGIYATNVFRRRGEAGWSMILHQNSPPPPPAR
ncbi:nuclear transport factor 2 family protein [Thiohalocapsa sp. ML1]|jgi:ketosteroid isomerase-like protein|uniref:YybH family protein n=1 Tax=Thiohalocapsa sp. ML1 TaxID=1431688 RepID=UPI00073215CC|nr:nuclear transport factor 2 family protein [Thiohalocapsa sp. ML1]